jgi:acyl carrier protein
MAPVTANEQYEKDVIEILKELTADWDDLGGGAALSPETGIVADLGFESLDVVYMVTAIEERYARRDLPFEQLLMVDGSYVTDLTVRQIAQFLQQNMNA